MSSLTLRLPKRAAEGNDCLVELYRWTDGAMEPAPFATTSIPAAEVAPGSDLDPGNVQDFFLDEKGASGEFETTGKKLYAAVFKGDVADAWNALSKKDLRVYLAIEDEELARLPWELMTDDASLPVFLRRNPLFLRCRSHRLAAIDPDEPWPIKVLVVVGCKANQAEELGVDHELAAIRTFSRSVDHSFDLEVLDARRKECNPTEIRGRIDNFKPHVLHFIGHATADANGAALQLWSQRLDTWMSWPARQITLSLQNIQHDLRLAYLNACRTHVQAPANRPSPVASIAGAFFAADVPAVIGMQADIHGEAASVCAAGFYEQLFAGDALDAALEVGRIKVMDLPGLGDDTRYPYCPVLTVQAEPDRILRYRNKVVDEARRNSIETCSTLKPVRSLFINQRDRRRDLLSTFFAAPAGQKRSAAVFRGSQDAGKSWLAKWFLGACAFQNHGVRYVEVRYCANWLEMMREVVSRGKDGHYVTQPLPPTARDYFYWHLNHIARDKPVPPGEPPPDVQDENHQLTDAIAGDNEAVSKIMEAFLETLRIAAGDGYFLLVADHWHPSGDHGTAQVTIKDLKENLWDRIAQDHQSRVKLLLILPPAAPTVLQADEYPEVHWKKIDLKEIPGAEMSDLLLELYRLTYKDEPSEEEMSAIQAIKTPALPKRIAERCDFIRRDFGGKP